jgi:hypothetical protein
LGEVKGPVADDEGPVAGDRIWILRHAKRQAPIALPGRRWIDRDPARLRGGGPRTLSRRADRRRAGAAGRSKNCRSRRQGRLASLNDARTGHAGHTGTAAPHEGHRHSPQEGHCRRAQNHECRPCTTLAKTRRATERGTFVPVLIQRSFGIASVRFLCAHRESEGDAFRPTVASFRGVGKRTPFR